MRLRVNPSKYKLEFVNFVVGAAVLTFELTAARIVAPYSGSSIYIWTSIIGVILAALSLGYWLGGKMADLRRRNEDIVLLLAIAAGFILLVNVIKDPLLSSITDNSLPLQWQALIASLVLFAVPTILLGMVSPYLARLNITKLANSGQKLASINAWGTVGSLFGTFLTGYVLFGFVGTRYMLAGIAATLILISFVMSGRTLLPMRAALLLVILLSFFSPPALSYTGIKAEEDTRYSRVTVRDVQFGLRPVRVLQTDRQYWQSGVYLDGDKSLVFPYTQGFYLLSQSNPSAQSSLVIGGGAFTFPEYLARAMPTSKVDVVEIDGGLVDISKKYFDFSPPANLNVIIADGRQYLNSNDKKYDFIFVDAFSSVEPPFQLFTKEAALRAKSSLTPDGAWIANVISSVEGPKSEMVSSVVSTYRHIFKNVDVYQVDAGYGAGHRQNLLVVASNKRLNSPLSHLRLSYPPKAGRVLTDNFAPVERMSSNGV